VDLKRIDQDGSHQFELHVDGEKVSWLRVIDFDMTYGCSIVRMGGIAGVGTKEEHRLKGYASRVLNATVDWMSDQGYHCSLLFGIPDFYWRFGYATVLSDATTTVLVRAAETAGDLDFTVRPLDEEDIPRVRRLHNENASGRICGLILPDSWTGFRKSSSWNQKAGCLVVESPAGEFAGYGVYDLGCPEVKVSEVETSDRRAQGALLKAFAKTGVKNREKEIRFLGPSNHPFAVFCRRFGAVHTERIERCARGMARLCDLFLFFSAVAAELGRRSLVLPADTNTSVGFKTDIGQCTLKVNRGRVEPVTGITNVDSTVECKQSTLVRLVFGICDYQDFALGKDVVITGDPGPVLSALFPMQPATIPPTNHF